MNINDLLVSETLKEGFKLMFRLISDGIVMLVERKLFQPQDQPTIVSQHTSSTLSTDPDSPDNPRKRPCDGSPRAAKRARLQSFPPLHEINRIHLRRVVWMPRFEEAYPSNLSQSVELIGGSILSDALHTILQEFPSITHRRALCKYLEGDSKMHEFAIHYQMHHLLNPNLAGTAEHKKQLAGCFKVYLGALYLDDTDEGIDMVTDFITELIRPIINASKNLDSVSTQAKRDLKSSLGPKRCALRYVAQPDENGLFPHTVWCVVKDEVLGTGRGIT